MGGVRNGGTEEDPRQDLNPGAAALLGLNYAVWEQKETSLLTVGLRKQEGRM